MKGLISYRIRAAWFIAAVLCSSSEVSFAKSAAVVKELSGVRVPCDGQHDEKQASGLRYCEGREGVKQQSIELITKRAREVVTEWYQGTNFYPNTCSLRGTIFSGAEIDSNHLGRSCGEWARLRTIPTGLRDSMTYVDLSGFRREHAYIAGGQVQAVDCHLRRVISQIEAGTLTVSACRGMAGGFASQLTGVVDHLGSFAENVSGVKRDVGKTREMLDKCDFKRQQEEAQKRNAADDKIGTKSERLVMQACRLTAQRAAVEAMFQQLAICEIFASAKVTFQAFENRAPQEISGQLDNWAQRCRNRCGMSQSCQDECYRREVTDFIRNQQASAFGNCG